MLFGDSFKDEDLKMKGYKIPGKSLSLLWSLWFAVYQREFVLG